MRRNSSRHERGLRPDGGQAEQDGEHERAHNRHNLGDVELENRLGNFAQSFGVRDDGQVRDDAVARQHGEERRADGGDVGEQHRHGQDARDVLSQARDGRSDKADDDERHAEIDKLAEHVLDDDHHVHDLDGGDEADHDAKDDRHEQDERQAGNDLSHGSP